MTKKPGFAKSKLWLARTLIKSKCFWYYLTRDPGSYTTHYVIYVWAFGRKWDMFKTTDPIK